MKDWGATGPEDQRLWFWPSLFFGLMTQPTNWCRKSSNMQRPVLFSLNLIVDLPGSWNMDTFLPGRLGLDCFNIGSRHNCMGSLPRPSHPFLAFLPLLPVSRFSQLSECFRPGVRHGTCPATGLDAARQPGFSLSRHVVRGSMGRLVWRRVVRLRESLLRRTTGC